MNINLLKIKFTSKQIWRTLFVLFINVLFLSNVSYSQSNFTIKSGCDLCGFEEGKKLLNYIKEKDYNIIRDSCITLSPIEINYNRNLVFINNQSVELSDKLLEIFKNWSSCSETKTINEKSDIKKTNSWVPFVYVPERLAKNWQIGFDTSSNKNIMYSLNSYVNPYIQAFGGDPLGLPLTYKGIFGLVMGYGIPYSGPFETDFVKAGLHLAVFEVSVTSRIKEFVFKYSSSSTDTVESPNNWLGNWNNIFTPHLGIEFAFDIPLVRISYFSTIDTLQDITDNPIIVYNEVTGEPMRNNVVRGEHFGFEIRTPNLIFYNSTRAKFYFAKQFGEYHLGYTGREMKIDDFIFDFRMDATFPGKRDFQLLTELYLDSPWKGFANKAFGFGPSIRLGNTPANNFGVISAFINFRFKVGDFFDKNIY